MTDLKPNWAGEFPTFDSWVSCAEHVLTGRPYSTGGMGKDGNGMPALCIDSKGRRCAIGKDFMRARDEDAFPVKYLWDFESAAS